MANTNDCGSWMTCCVQLHASWGLEIKTGIHALLSILTETDQFHNVFLYYTESIKESFILNLARTVHFVLSYLDIATCTWRCNCSVPGCVPTDLCQ